MITLDDYIGATIDDLTALYDSLEPEKKGKRQQHR